MAAGRDRTGVVLRGAVAVAIASTALLATHPLTAQSASTGATPGIEGARPSRPDDRSDGRIVGAEWASLAGVLGLSIGLGAAAVALALRPRGDRPPLAPDRPWVALALVLGVLGPALLWPARDSPRGVHTGAVAALGGWLCVLVAWVLIGAGLRPRGSSRRGAFFALALYALVGFVVVHGLRLHDDSLGRPELASPVALAVDAAEGLALPLGLADRFGLFGYVTYAN